MVESMCLGGFKNKTKIKAWVFFEHLAKKTSQQETTRVRSLNARIDSQKGGNACSLRYYLYSFKVYLIIKHATEFSPFATT